MNPSQMPPQQNMGMQQQRPNMMGSNTQQRQSGFGAAMSGGMRPRMGGGYMGGQSGNMMRPMGGQGMQRSQGYNPQQGFMDPNRFNNGQRPMWGGNTGQQQPQQQWRPYQGEDVGHEGTTAGGMNRQQFRDSWMQSGIGNSQQMDEWLAKNGGQRLNDAGVVRTPFGETLDMGIAYKTGQGKPGWTDIGMNEQGPQQGWAGQPSWMEQRSQYPQY